jgi:hypothetical protein
MHLDLGSQHQRIIFRLDSHEKYSTVMLPPLYPCSLHLIPHLLILQCWEHKMCSPTVAQNPLKGQHKILEPPLITRHICHSSINGLYSTSQIPQLQADQCCSCYSHTETQQRHNDQVQNRYLSRYSWARVLRRWRVRSNHLLHRLDIFSLRCFHSSSHAR